MGLRQDRTLITSLIPIPGKTTGKDYGGSHRATWSGQIYTRPSGGDSPTWFSPCHSEPLPLLTLSVPIIYQALRGAVLVPWQRRGQAGPS